MGTFYRSFREAGSYLAVRGRIWPKFELIQALLAVLLTCKNEEDPIKMKASTGGNNIIHTFFRRSRADNSGVSRGTWSKFVLTQAFMHVLNTCKYENDFIKNSRENVMISFSPFYVYGIFFPYAQRHGSSWSDLTKF